MCVVGVIDFVFVCIGVDVGISKLFVGAKDGHFLVKGQESLQGVDTLDGVLLC